jgi:glycosyltransferase involved in cell wall biosynthesis
VSARVTAIVPVKAYHEPYLRESFASLIGQTCDRWRAVVVVEPEDRSRFRDLLAAELADARIRLIANEGRKLAGAINTGIRAATTDFAAILLADDKWERSAVEVLTRQIESHSEVDFFHTARRAVDDEGRPCSGILPPMSEVRAEAFVYFSQVKHLLCFRRSMALEVGGIDESINSVGPDDYDFPWTMAERGARFRAIPECLYIYRDHRQTYRLTTHLPMSVHTREIIRIMRKHGVSWPRTLQRVLAARRGYLQQCMYRNRLHRWMVETLGVGAPRMWREPRP